MTPTATAPVRRFRWEYVPALPPAAEEAERLRGRRVLVIGAPEGRGPAVAAAVSAALVARGAVLWRPEDPTAPDAVVDLGLPDRFDPSAPDAADEALRRTLAVLRRCYAEWAAEPDARRLSYLAVTYLGGHAEPGARRVHQPLGGIWAGLAKTLHRELPTLCARVVDVGHPDLPRLPRIVAAELYADGPAEVGYVDGQRRVLVPRPRAVGPPGEPLAPGEVVLVCGGGTGVGFAIATGIARRHGCRVVVTGRAALPLRTEEELVLDAAAFDEHCADLLRAAAARGQVREARARVTKLRQRRLLLANLTAAAAEHLPVEYLTCDCTDPADVTRLVERIGPALTGVVYLGGVDRPARLPAKSDDDVLAAIAVKVSGFMRVFAAVRHLPLRFFSNAGSLTGRLGGMVGELDYAAANEALARLGLWARRDSGLDVLTVCWPLWDGLSVSPNVGAALRYMPAIDPADGVDRWCAELAAPRDGEVAFVGPVGDGIGFAQGGQFPVEPALPGFASVYPRVFHRGRPAVWVPGARVESAMTWRLDRVPAAADFHVDGGAALPVSVLLENVVRLVEWLVEELRRGDALELSDVRITPAGLRFHDGVLRLDRTAAVRADGAVEVCARASGSGAPVAELVMTRADPDPPPPAPPPGTAVGVRAAVAAHPGMGWTGAVVPAAAWQRHRDGTWVADVRGCASADLWTAEPAPATRLPVAALENILRVEVARCGEVRGRLRIARIAVRDADARPALVVWGRPGDRWRAVDRDSARVVADVRGVDRDL